MTVIALTLYNLLHPNGYRLPADLMALTKLPSREVQSRFLSQPSTANGEQARFADTYNYIESDVFAMGSVSQDYICNTHHKYFPNPQDKVSQRIQVQHLTQVCSITGCCLKFSALGS
jgi:hypothetical protein